MLEMKMEPLKESRRKSLIDIAEEKALKEMEELRLKHDEILRLKHDEIQLKFEGELDNVRNEFELGLQECKKNLQESIVSAFKERARKYNEKTKESKKAKTKKKMSMTRFTYYLYIDIMILAFSVAFFFVYYVGAPFVIVGGLFIGIMLGIILLVMFDLISFIYKKYSKKINRKN